MARNSFQNRSEKSSLNRAFHFLSFRSRSEKEMRDFLEKKEISVSEIEDTITRLKELELIDDKKFVLEFVSARSKNKPKGKKALIIELEKKGIKVENLDIDEGKLAEEALNKKRNIFDKAKAERFLYSRGFSWGTIEKTVKKLYNSENVNYE